jgi:arylsulfatase
LSNFDKDKWQLFHTDEDRSEAHDLSEKHPEKVKELADMWLVEAKKYNVLPLNDMAVVGKDLEKFVALEFHVPVSPSGKYTYYPNTTPDPGTFGCERPRRLIQDPRGGRDS